MRFWWVGDGQQSRQGLDGILKVELVFCAELCDERVDDSGPGAARLGQGFVAFRGQRDAGNAGVFFGWGARDEPLLLQAVNLHGHGRLAAMLDPCQVAYAGLRQPVDL